MEEREWAKGGEIIRLKRSDIGLMQSEAVENGDRGGKKSWRQVSDNR